MDRDPRLRSALTLAVAGRSVGVDVPAPWAPRTERALRQIGPPAEGGPPDLGFTIEPAEDWAGVPATADLLTHYGEAVRVWAEGEDRWVWSEGALTHLDLGADTATLSVAKDDAEPWARAVGAHLVVGLSLWLRTQGRDPLHAAGVSRDGAGVLIVGPSDVGKSTLALRLVEAGWHALSDDTVVLYDADGAVRASGFRRSFALDDRPAGAPARRLPGGEDKWSVDVAAVYPDRFAASSTPRLLVFPTLTGEPTSHLQPMAPAEAFLALAAQSALRELRDDHTRRQHERLSRLLAQAPPFRLSAGRDLLVAEAADRLLWEALTRTTTP